MRLLNKTKNTYLAQDVIIARTFFSRAKGLLGRRQFKGPQAIVLKPCSSIHTFFMRFPIDVIFVDRDNKVVGAISSIRPFRLSPIYFNSRFAIELPSGTLNSTSTQTGDTVLLE